MATFKFQSNMSNEEIRRRLREATGDDIRLYEGERGERVAKLSSEQASKLNRLPVGIRHAAFGGRVRQQLNG